MDDDQVSFKYGTSDAEIEQIFTDLDALLLVGEPEEKVTTITPAEISIVKNDYRRSMDYAGMVKRRKLLIAKQPLTEKQKTRIFRTGFEIRRRLESTEAMRCASDSAKGNLEATIVYIDLLAHLPSTVTHPVKLEHQFKQPKWRELSDQATACFYQLGAASIEAETNYTLVPFSWNLSQGLWEAARDFNQHDVSYLQHRLITALKRGLHRPPELVCL